MYAICSQAQANCRVGIAALNTLAGYIDWVAMSHITADNCKLLEMLCLLLNEPELQVGAAECLLIVVSRKVSLLSSHISACCLPVPLSSLDSFLLHSGWGLACSKYKELK